MTMDRIAWSVLLWLLLLHVLAEGKTDWSLEFDPSDPMQTAIVTVSFILIFTGIIFLIFIILTLCTPARRKRREHRRHCRHHCRPKSAIKSATLEQHAKDPRSPGMPRHDFHHAASGLPFLPDDLESDSDECSEVVIHTEPPASRRKSSDTLPGRTSSHSHDRDEDKSSNASAGHATRYKLPVRVRPQFSREQLVDAVSGRSLLLPVIFQCED